MQQLLLIANIHQRMDVFAQRITWIWLSPSIIDTQKIHGDSHLVEQRSRMKPHWDDSLNQWFENGL